MSTEFEAEAERQRKRGEALPPFSISNPYQYIYNVVVTISHKEKGSKCQVFECQKLLEIGIGIGNWLIGIASIYTASRLDFKGKRLAPSFRPLKSSDFAVYVVGVN